MEFIERLKEELKKRGITKTELGRMAEISEGTIRNWEKGKQPSLDKAVKISNILQISLDELCEISVKNNDMKIIAAYEAASPEIKTAVNKLLDIKEEQEELTSSISKIG